MSAEFSVLELTIWKDMGHQVGIDPANLAGVHISDLKKVVDRRITCSSAAVDHMPHPPIPVMSLAGEEVMPHDHRHPWSHVQKKWSFLSVQAVCFLSQRDAHQASTFVLTALGFVRRAPIQVCLSGPSVVLRGQIF